MKIGSLFSGIGGLELGLERAGCGRTVWQCEIDPYARAVLAKHWPDAIRFDDITKMTDVPPVDLICGGFPCQDISNAGKRVGIEGARSGLFFELMRVVRLVRPRFVVLENVAALLGRGLGAVLGELSESGYDAEWDCIPASAVGAHHQRDRVFIIGTLADAQSSERRPLSSEGDDPHGADAGRPEEASRFGERGEVLADADCEGSRRLQPEQTGRSEASAFRSGREDVPDADKPRLEGRNLRGYSGSPRSSAVKSRWSVSRSWQPECRLGRSPDGIRCGMDDCRGWECGLSRVTKSQTNRVNRLRCLGNAVVPQVAEVVGRRVMDLVRGRKA